MLDFFHRVITFIRDRRRRILTVFILAATFVFLGKIPQEPIVETNLYGEVTFMSVIKHVYIDDFSIFGVLVVLFISSIYVNGIQWAVNGDEEEIRDREELAKMKERFDEQQ